MKILVLDDNHLLALILADHLRDGGHEVQAVFDGEQALGLCQASRYDLLVIDLALPGLSGADVLERLQGLGPLPRVIVISGFPELVDEEYERLGHLGVESIVHKPFSFTDLDDILARPDEADAGEPPLMSARRAKA